ncbi:aminomethyl transferase family protein, partial [bacterium]|nr:aminomethyl transferase family protein [bacterium]
GDASVWISRTGFTGDLGYEVFCEAGDALGVWDAIFEAGTPHGMLPLGQIAIVMSRIEAGLLLVHADFDASRLAERLAAFADGGTEAMPTQRRDILQHKERGGEQKGG